jgi:hypothetical protein
MWYVLYYIEIEIKLKKEGYCLRGKYFKEMLQDLMQIIKLRIGFFLF